MRSIFRQTLKSSAQSNSRRATVLPLQSLNRGYFTIQNPLRFNQRALACQSLFCRSIPVQNFGKEDLKTQQSYIEYTHGNPIAEDFKNPVYDEMFDRSVNDREAFFDEYAQGIEWFKKYTKVIDTSDQYMHRWFPDGETNLAFNCLDRHVRDGYGDRVCFYEDSVYTGKKKAWTYAEVMEQSGRLATVMKNEFNIKPGDTVVLYMPMIIESAFTMLACARIGAVHSVVFGGFAPKELANRVDDCKPKLIVTSSCGIEPGKHLKYPPIVDEALS